MAPEEVDYYPDLGRSFDGVTLRQVAVATLGGSALRVSISNQYGQHPLLIRHVHVALARERAQIDPASDRELTFSGRQSVAVPPGAEVMSDAVRFETFAGGALAISFYLPHSTSGSTASVHEQGWRTGYVSPRGDYSGAADFTVAAELHDYFFLAAIDESARQPAAAVVALGDSITDGTGATPDAGRSWPDVLARRLAGRGPVALSVVNMGIGGNRLLHASTGPSALSRVDRDVFAVPGVRFVILFEGINDIAGWPGHPEEDVTAADIELALDQLAARAHVHALRVLVATITPTLGCPDCGGPAGEVIRQTVNAWIRHSESFDGVIDFDRVLRDPADPRRIRPEFDSGDHLHPSDAGYRAMAESVDLRLFSR